MDLKEKLNIQLVSDLVKYSEAELNKELIRFVKPTTKVARLSNMLWCLSRGIDTQNVTERGPPKSIAVEDSFQAKTCKTIEDVRRVLGKLCPDLIDRLLDEDCNNDISNGMQKKRKTFRVPRKLTVKWRYGDTYSSTSSSIDIPSVLRKSMINNAYMKSSVLSRELEITAIAEAAESVMRRTMGTFNSFSLTKISLTATNFETISPELNTFVSNVFNVDRPLEQARSNNFEETDFINRKRRADVLDSPIRKAPVASKKSLRKLREEINEQTLMKYHFEGCATVVDANVGDDRYYFDSVTCSHFDEEDGQDEDVWTDLLDLEDV